MWKLVETVNECASLAKPETCCVSMTISLFLSASTGDACAGGEGSQCVCEGTFTWVMSASPGSLTAGTALAFPDRTLAAVLVAVSQLLVGARGGRASFGLRGGASAGVEGGAGAGSTQRVVQGAGCREAS